MDPTVDFLDPLVILCSIATVGEIPEILSTAGLPTCSINWRAYEDIDSKNRLCPSAKITSKASDDLPEPEGPVITTNCLVGIEREISRRLFSFAPVISRCLLILGLENLEFPELGFGEEQLS